MDEQELYEEKATFYMEEELPVHLNLAGGRWANGKIVKLKEKGFILNEDKMGVTLVFYSEIINLVPRKKREGE